MVCMPWDKKVEVKQFMVTDPKATPDQIQTSMTKIAEVLVQHNEFGLPLVQAMRQASDLATANRLLTEMYDVADDHRIWICGELGAEVP